MDALGMLNALIGLALVYFVLSLIVSTATEWISQSLGVRGKVLELAAARLIGLDAAPDRGGGAAAGAADAAVARSGAVPDAAAAAMTRAFRDFFAHPRIQALQQDSRRPPSYVPNATFAVVLAESLLGRTGTQLRQAPALLRARIEALPGDLAIRESLMALLDESDGDPGRFFAGLERWVDETWERATGWLRRRLSWPMFALALAVAGVTNADTVRMFQVMTRDATLREALVKTAGELAAKGSAASLDAALCPAPEPSAAAADAPASDAACSEMQAARRYALDVSPLLGWEKDWGPGNGPMWYVGKLVGLLITACALMMGAPFWFDMLKKLISVRQSVRPGEAPGRGAGPEEAPAPAPAAPAERPSKTAIPVETATLTAFRPHAAQLSRDNAVWLSRFSDLAYSPRALAVAQGAEWDYVVTGRFDAAEGHTQYLLATRADTAILAFRGTEPGEPADWMTDAEVGLEDCPWRTGSRIHQGFHRGLEEVWSDLVAAIDALGPDKSLWITGHSLGGALALLAAYRLACARRAGLRGLITYGQPRCGDAAFAEDVQRCLAGRYWRAVNNRDLVPRIPPHAAGFRHAGTVLYLDDLGRVLIDPPIWYRALDTLDLPADASALRQALRERVQDHAIERYARALAAAGGWPAAAPG